MSELMYGNTYKIRHSNGTEIELVPIEEVKAIKERVKELEEGLRFIDSKLGKNQWPAKRKIKQLLS